MLYYHKKRSVRWGPTCNIRIMTLPWLARGIARQTPHSPAVHSRRFQRRRAGTLSQTGCSVCGSPWPYGSPSWR